MTRYMIVCVLYASLLLLSGCALASAVAGLGQPLDTSTASYNELTKPMPAIAIDLEKSRCLNGYYTGKDVQTLLSDGKRWGNAKSGKYTGRVYTYIYKDYENDAFDNINWYEHWYQLHDYDQDSKIDDCKYYKIHKGSQSPTVSKDFEEFSKKNHDDFVDFKRRNNIP